MVNNISHLYVRLFCEFDRSYLGHYLCIKICGFYQNIQQRHQKINKIHIFTQQPNNFIKNIGIEVHKKQKITIKKFPQVIAQKIQHIIDNLPKSPNLPQAPPQQNQILQMNISKQFVIGDYINQYKIHLWRQLRTIQYNILLAQLNYEQISKDVSGRNRLMNDYKSIIQRRIRIENQYLYKMKQLASTPEMRKVQNVTKASQYIYNSLINAINAEVENLTNHVSRLQAQISKQLSSNCTELQNDSKRNLINASVILKDYQRRHDDLQKLKVKVMKKSNQLRKLKQQYIVGTLIDIPFDKKNKLFIRTKQIQQSYRPMHTEFEQSVKHFNEKANTAADKLKQILQKIENNENQKVELMKKIFMVLQISNSQYGAYLIQDKASILTRINNLQNINPEFKKSDNSLFQTCKKQMISSHHDPCSYINSLFTNIVDTKNMQGLVVYGHQMKHRESISECMTQAIAINNTEQQKSENQFVFVRDIASCFKNIFNEDIEFDEQKYKKLQQLMQNSPEGRKNFILCLQKFRTISKFDISQKKLKPIQGILNLFLDQCMRQLDTYNSKLLLVLSFTYYVMVGDERKDLHIYIKQHKIWKDKQWWQCALLESSYEQLKIKPKKSEQVPITIWHIKGSGIKHLESQHQLTAQNVLFNQLTFYIHNMRLFDLREQLITYFAKKYVKCFQLSPKIAADIEPFLKFQQASSEQIDIETSTPTNGSSPVSSMKKKFITKFFLSKE